MARRFAPIFGWLSPTLKELSDHPDSWVNKLPTTLPTQVPVGIVVAKGDLVVASESTQLPGVEHVQRIAGMHAGILAKSETFQATVHFLREGTFPSAVP